MNMANFLSCINIGDGPPDIDAIEADAGGDISHARLKLDDLLNEIVDRNEDSHSTDEETQRPHDLATVSTRRLHSQRTPRKRKKKDLGHNATRASYIIKLFDREIDLAQFESNTTLYTMLREWMRNRPGVPSTFEQSSESKPPPPPLETQLNETSFNPHLFESSMLPSNEDVAPEAKSPDSEALYELPNALQIKSDSPHSFPCRSPPTKTASIKDVINKEENMDELRRNNMLRWRKVKNDWREHSFCEQRRNMESLKILKDMFTQQTSKLV